MSWEWGGYIWKSPILPLNFSIFVLYSSDEFLGSSSSLPYSHMTHLTSHNFPFPRGTLNCLGDNIAKP